MNKFVEITRTDKGYAKENEWFDDEMKGAVVEYFS